MGNGIFVDVIGSIHCWSNPFMSLEFEDCNLLQLLCAPQLMICVALWYDLRGPNVFGFLWPVYKARTILWLEHALVVCVLSHGASQSICLTVPYA